MYSMVLMMALSTGASTPATHHGCYGCYGGNACYGSCYGGCNGCYGGGCWGNGHGCLGGLFRHWGGHGSCNGCYGTCYGGHGCYGCYGGCYGGAAAPAHHPLPPGEKPGPGAKPPAGGATPPPVGKEEVRAPHTARLLVSVPADAKLFIDDVATKSTSDTRLFVTPALKPGQDYVYTLKAEIKLDGRTETVTKQVTVRAGRTTETSINLPVATAAK